MANSSMIEDQIKHMVDRFLAWKLPASFNPDGGISFAPLGNEGMPHQYKREPSGTNLLDATQAEAMVRHMIEGWLMACEACTDARLRELWKEHGGGFNKTRMQFFVERDLLPDLLRKIIASAERAAASPTELAAKSESPS